MSIMNTMKDIDKLLSEAETGKISKILDRITEDAKPFWLGCEERVLVSRLLREHFGIKISESAVRNHFLNLVKDAN